MPIETIIFDMDGVLVDSEVYWEKARMAFAHERGKRWDSADNLLVMGRSTVGWAGVMRERLGLEMSVEAIIAEMKERVLAYYEQAVPVRPGALEAVRLAAGHFRVGLASGSPTDIIDTVMRLTGLDKVFETIVHGDSIPKGKPAPDIYLEALRRLNQPAHTALGIEDSANGLRAVKAAGMYALAAPSPDFPLPPDILALAEAHISSLEDFSLELVARIGEGASDV